MKYTIPRATISLDFQEMDPDNLLTFAHGVFTALSGSTVFTQLIVPIADIGVQINDLQNIITLIASGDKRTSNLKLRDDRANNLMLSLTADAHDVEAIATKTGAGDILIVEQLILTTGYKLKDKVARTPRDFEVVETGPGWAHIRTVKEQKGNKIIHWAYGITTVKGIPPNTLIRHTTDKVNIIITDLPSGAVIGICFSGAELASKIKKWEHPSFSHIAAEQLEWSDFIYFVVP
jgi:hypothetical protein